MTASLVQPLRSEVVTTGIFLATLSTTRRDPPWSTLRKTLFLAFDLCLRPLGAERTTAR